MNWNALIWVGRKRQNVLNDCHGIAICPIIHIMNVPVPTMKNIRNGLLERSPFWLPSICWMKDLLCLCLFNLSVWFFFRKKSGFRFISISNQIAHMMSIRWKQVNDNTKTCLRNDFSDYVHRFVGFHIVSLLAIMMMMMVVQNIDWMDLIRSSSRWSTIGFCVQFVKCSFDSMSQSKCSQS